MKKSIRTSTVAISLSALILAGTGAAYASHTKISVAGSTAVGNAAYTAVNDSVNIAFTTDYGFPITCSSASITGAGSVIKRGTPVAVGNTIATIGNLSASCSLFGLISAVFTMTGGDIKVKTHPTNAGDPVPVTITGVDADFESRSPWGCKFDVHGTLDAVIKPGTGTKDATIELVPATFSSAGIPLTGFDMIISGVSGCAGEVQNGDRMAADFPLYTGTTRSTFVLDTAGVVTHN